ncbi:MAG: hypothetical protein ACXVAY_06010 [Mucilaginibacter sp.]
MKNHLMRAAVFIALGAALFTVSALSKNSAVEKWSSFLFGFSFPLFIGGIISLVQHFKKAKATAETNS